MKISEDISKHIFYSVWLLMFLQMGKVIGGTLILLDYIGVTCGDSIVGRSFLEMTEPWKLFEERIKKLSNQYTKKLDALEDKKVIRSYIDESDTKTDTYRFKVSVDMKFDLTHDNIIVKLKLFTKFSENYTSIDENNSVFVFKSAAEIMDAYMKIKLEYLQKRKDYLINTTKRDLLLLASKYLFVKNVTDGNIKVNKVKKADIITQLDTYDKIIHDEGTYDYLLRMPIYSLTQEKLNELLEKIKNKKVELGEIQAKDIKDTWRDEIALIK